MTEKAYAEEGGREEWEGGKRRRAGQREEGGKEGSSQKWLGNTDLSVYIGYTFLCDKSVASNNPQEYPFPKHTA